MTPRLRTPSSGLLALSIGSIVVSLLASAASGQSFVAVTDTTNPIVAATVSGAYTGASWVDVDDDGLLDLFINRKQPIYHNLGGGVFVIEPGAILGQGLSLGNTWADYDNDGDLDLYVSGGPNVPDRGSILYRNEGSFLFTRVTTGDVGNASFNSGWGASWGDLDNDAYADIVVAAANGFAGVTHENRILLNNGDGTFTNIDSTVATDSLDAHTIPTLYDYDLDGDVDLFIGSGEISQLSPDNHFRSTLVETGGWGFERITTAPIATDLLDGQVWNWIDYDNDGDLDAYQTNYNFNLPNKLYRNDSGAFVAMSQVDAGTIVSELGAALANVWSDFDNDGDLDCLVTYDGASVNDFFVNDGDGTFTQDLTSALVQGAGPHYSATAGDWDNDGDVDLYVHGTTATKRLYRNDLANGNHWVNIELIGAGAPGSNRAALGATVRAKAVIGGSPTWQMRQVNAQNSFNAMNMLNVHFGLGDATSIDTLIVEWPAGGSLELAQVPADRFYQLFEGANPTSAVGSLVPWEVALLQNAPNPFRASTAIAFETRRRARVTLDIYDVAGRLVRTLVDEVEEPGLHRVVWDGRDRLGRRAASGGFLYRLRALDESGTGPLTETRRMVRLE